jgi:hypothetical protein
MIRQASTRRMFFASIGIVVISACAALPRMISSQAQVYSGRRSKVIQAPLVRISTLSGRALPSLFDGLPVTTDGRIPTQRVIQSECQGSVRVAFSRIGSKIQEFLGFGVVHAQSACSGCNERQVHQPCPQGCGANSPYTEYTLQVTCDGEIGVVTCSTCQLDGSMTCSQIDTGLCAPDC